MRIQSQPFVRFSAYQETKKPAAWASEGLIQNYDQTVKPLAERLDQALAEKGFACGPDQSIQMKIDWPLNQIKITPKTRRQEGELMEVLRGLGGINYNSSNSLCQIDGVLIDCTSEETFRYVEAIERRLKAIQQQK